MKVIYTIKQENIPFDSCTYDVLSMKKVITKMFNMST